MPNNDKLPTLDELNGVAPQATPLPTLDELNGVQKKSLPQTTSQNPTDGSQSLQDAVAEVTQPSGQNGRSQIPATVTNPPEQTNTNPLAEQIKQQTGDKDVREWVWQKHNDLIDDNAALQKNNAILREFPKQPKFQEYLNLQQQLSGVKPDSPQAALLQKQIKDLEDQPLIDKPQEYIWSGGETSLQPQLATGEGQLGNVPVKSKDDAFAHINTVGDFVKMYQDKLNESNTIQSRSQQNQQQVNDVIKAQQALDGFQGNKDGVRELNALQTFGGSIYNTIDKAMFAAKYMLSDNDTRKAMQQQQQGQQLIEPEKPSGQVAELSGQAGNVLPFLLPGFALERAGVEGAAKTVGTMLSDGALFGLTNAAEGSINQYNEIFEKTRDENAALTAANNVFKSNLATGAATGGLLMPAFGALGGKVAGKFAGDDLAAEIEANGTKNIGYADYMKYVLPKHAVAALPFGIQTYVDNKIAQEQGSDRTSLEGVGTAYAAAGIMGGVLDHLAYGWDKLEPEVKDAYLNGMAKYAPEKVIETVDKAAQDGTINPVIADNIKNEIQDRSAAFMEMPKDLTPEKEQEVLPLIQQKNDLLKQQGDNKTLPDEHFVNQIEALDRQINETLGTPLTDAEQKEHENFKELQKGRNDAGQFENQLSDREKDLLEHYNKRIANGNENNDAGTSDGEKVPETKPVGTSDDIGKETSTKVGNVSISGHGEDEFTADGKENGTEKKDDLTAQGRLEAENQGADLAKSNPDLNTVFHGTVDRTIQTAKIVADKAGELLGKPIKTVLQPLLDTWNIGKAEGSAEGSFDEKAWADKKADVNSSFINNVKEDLEYKEPTKAGPDQEHHADFMHEVRVAISGNRTAGPEYQIKELPNEKKVSIRIKDHYSDPDYFNDDIENKGVTGVINIVGENKAFGKHKYSAEGYEKLKKRGIDVYNIDIKNGDTVSDIIKKVDAAMNEVGNKPGDAVPPGGESWNSFAGRAKQAWEFLKSHPDNDHAIASSKMERMLQSLNESDGDLDKAKELYFEKLKAEQDANTSQRNQAADNQNGNGQVQSNGNDRQLPSEEQEKSTGSSSGNSVLEGEKEGKVAGISTEVMQKIANRLGIKAPESGEGIDPADVLPLGKALLDAGADPQKILEDFTNGQGVSKEGAAIIRAKAAELTKAAYDVEEKFGANDPRTQTAKEALQKFNEDAKPYATEASNVLKSYQGETDVDTGSWMALRDAAAEESGKELTPKQIAEAKELSGKVNTLTAEVETLKQKLDDAISKSVSDSPNKKNYTAKAKELADKIRTLKSKPFTFKDENGNEIQFTQNSIIPYNDIIEAIAKGVEVGGKIADAVKEALDKYKDEDWYKKLSQYDKNSLADKLTGHLTPDDADIHTRFVDKKDSKFTPEDVKDIWDYAKENYLDKEKDFAQTVAGVSMDLGLSPEQVRDAISMPKGARKLTDEMYRKQSDRNKAVRDAKEWVKYTGQSNDSTIRKGIRAISNIPNLLFAAKVFGHGTVAPITHAGMDLFQPTGWKNYFKFFIEGFKNAYGSRAEYEKRMADLTHDPMYNFAKRSGLAIDPYQRYDDYQQQNKYLAKAGKPGEILKRAIEVGDRGFNALKTYRLAKFKQLYNGLSEVEKADPNTPKELAKIVNHSTGTSDFGIKNETANKVLSTLTFAPKLEASRWARLIVEPAKAFATITNWKNSTPSERAAAKIVTKRSAETAATYFTALAANAGLNALFGSDDKINVTDPTKGDFLKFKIAGKEVNLTGGMLSSAHFIGNLLGEAFAKDKDRKDKYYEMLGNYGRGKLSPFAGTAFDFATHKDYDKNILPPFDDQPTYNRVTDNFNHKMSWSEFALKNLAPIPVAEGIKNVEQAMANKGLTKPQIKEILNGLFVGSVSGLTGANIKEESEPKK